VRRRLLAFLLCVVALGVHGNVITEENTRPGTDEWNVYARALNGEIEGFASRTSVRPGESIRFYVNASDPRYTIEVFRMGWYGGAGGRRMTDAVERATVHQPIPVPDPDTGLIECHWSDPFELTIPHDWVSGVYLAKLTALPGRLGSWIIFVVRAASDRHATFLIQTSVTTYQAYNEWGGKSLYDFNSTGGRAYKVSFNRPYGRKSGAADFLLGYEYPAVRFFEREGYDVEYSTDIDTHENPDELLGHDAVIDIGHDEYWTWEMRDAFEKARDEGVDLIFLSANTCYWQVRLEASPLTGERDRVIAAWKESAAQLDPVLHDADPSNDHLATTLWRNAPVSRPEDGLVGTMYVSSPVSGDVVVGDTSHWVFAGTGLSAGDHLDGLLGYEVDRSTSSAPPTTIVLTHSPFTARDGSVSESNMTIYSTAARGFVFATGTMYWAFGLDDYNLSLRPFAPVSAAAQQITRNVLEHATNRPRRRAVR